MENAQDAFEQAWKKLVSQGEAAAAPQKAFTPVGLRKDVQETGPLYHGTRADLRPGDLLTPGYPSNYGRRERANYVYVTAQGGRHPRCGTRRGRGARQGLSG